jgi:excisionase family DNA binding protein
VDIEHFHRGSVLGDVCSGCGSQRADPTVQGSLATCPRRHSPRARRAARLGCPRQAAATSRRSPSYLRAAEVADILHVSPKTVSRWAKESKLPFLKTLGGHRRYPAAEIRQLAAELQVQPTS